MSDNIHGGHRARIDEKARLMGLEFLEEHEQLEKLLFTAYPRSDTNAIAHALLEEFGSVYGVLCADAEQLRNVKGVGTRAAEFLHDMLPLLGIAERSMMESGGGTALDTTEKVGEYARTLFHGKLVENLYMISLNSAMRVLRFDRISDGTPEAVNVSVRKIARRAVLNEAYAVALAHNHPGGRLEPSISDISLTREVRDALERLGIILTEHIIVACGEWKSIRI